MTISYSQRENFKKIQLAQLETWEYSSTTHSSCCFLSQPCLTSAGDFQSSACPKFRFFASLSYGTCAVHGLSLWPLEAHCTADGTVFSVQNIKADPWALQRPRITKGCLRQWRGEKAFWVPMWPWKVFQFPFSHPLNPVQIILSRDKDKNRFPVISSCLR